MKIRIALGLLFVLSVAGCKSPPLVNDDTIVSSTVDGVTLTYRHAITPPHTFSPVNEEYRALYNASVMSRPDFGGKVVRHLENAQPYTVLGRVENNWLAIAEKDQDQLIGYVPLRAVVKSALYEETIKADQRRKRVRATQPAKKKTCVAVDGDSKACQNSSSGTWIID
ncbi:SH3 domain-containing protein [Mixta calida]|uniref:SH3 domain-containing protein n=1 Tax=Mixta calida TaxID=665913 RepID=UPI00290D9470|nr:SH3 domain-containing protein [Mixta calida]MDU6536705.1 SH3 domain-containing protein [Mixta calida]